MNEEKLQQIQDEILREMDKETNKEATIVSMAREIGSQLSLGGSVKQDVEGKEFIFSYKQYTGKKGEQKLFMTVANPFMFEVGRDRYKPYMVDVEIDNDLTMRENLIAVVEAFLRHVFNMVKAEEL